MCVCVYPALLITKATGTLDDTSTSSEGDGERLEKVIVCVCVSRASSLKRPVPAG